MPQRPTPFPEIEHSVERLAARAERFARLPIATKRRLLRHIASEVWRDRERWVGLACDAKAIDPRGALAAQEWILGPAFILRNLRQLSAALAQIDKQGRPKLRALRQLPNGQYAATVLPFDPYDRVLFPDIRAEARFLKEATPDRIRQELASFYQRRQPAGSVALVLGAGNVASIPVLDVLYKLFVEGQVCLLKMNPVNDYLGALIERAFQALIGEGYLALIYGGAEVAAHAITQPGVSSLHMTGSTRTHDAIVWGPPGEEQERRKRNGTPLFTKPVSSELGDISPVLIAPGEYTAKELDAMAQHFAGMVVHNAGFNCLAGKLLITSRHWSQRSELIERMQAAFSSAPRRVAYYPGAEQAYERFTQAPGEVLRFSSPDDPRGSLPWALVLGLDPDGSALAFREEAFCGVLSETCLDTPSAEAFFDQASRFANERVWGTLCAMVFAPKALLKTKQGRARLDQCVDQLRYGTVTVNEWAALGYALGSTPWGAYPDSPLSNVQSGRGWVHNTGMLGALEKCVIEGPISPVFKPVWFPNHRSALGLGKELTAFEHSPSPRNLTRLFVHALRG